MRPPFLIAFDITRRCNLRCLHCYNDSGAGDGDMNAREIETAVEKIIRLKPMQICLCGGEPLLSPFLFDIIAKIRPKVRNLMMVSNGFLIDWNMAKRLVNAGIDSLQISLDGAFSWQHDSFRGVGGSFYHAVSAIKNLKRAGMKTVSVAIIINKMNCSSIGDFLSLCAEIGADAVHIMQMLPLGRGKDAVTNLSLSDEEIFRFCREMARLKPIYEGKMSVEWKDPVGSSQFIFNRGQKLNAPFSLAIRSNGKVLIDPYLPFDVGNILDADWKTELSHRLNLLWSDEKMTAELSRLCNLYDFANFSCGDVL